MELPTTIVVDVSSPRGRLDQFLAQRVDLVLRRRQPQRRVQRQRQLQRAKAALAGQLQRSLHAQPERRTSLRADFVHAFD